MIRWTLAFWEVRFRQEITWRPGAGVRSTLVTEEGIALATPDGEHRAFTLPARERPALDPPIDLDAGPSLGAGGAEELLETARCAALVRLAGEQAGRAAGELLDPRVVLFRGAQAVKVLEAGAGVSEDRRHWGQLGVSYVAGKDRGRFSHWRVSDLPPCLPPDLEGLADALVEDAVRLAALQNRARPASGRLDVVLGPGAPSALFHEIAHHFEADQPGAARLLGRRVGPPELGMVDDPTLPGLAGSMAFDDEGTRCRPTTLIDGGVVVGLLHTRQTAREMGVPPTGNARRQSFAHPPLARLTNTYIKPGAQHAASLVRSVSRGVYVKDVMNCLVNPRTGQVHVAFAEAYPIEGGEVSDQPVSGRLVSESPWDITQAVTGVAGDLRITGGRGLCGKADQRLPVSSGQATVRLGQITVT
ncbi:MAG: TldD/PmbA family protein [Acetobacteraceae bacterium]|nr:TldD/PmbA family protein [Acetobacteraceae bacterium]